MTTYTDVFGNTTLPPSEYGYVEVTLAANTTFSWPYTSSGSNLTAKIMDVTASSVGLALTLPPANEVSTGEDVLIRNVGSNSMSVKANDGTLLATVAAGAAKYFYLTDNSTVAGEWGVIAYGVGTSSVDAASLVGYGITAIGATLNQAHEVFPSATDVTIDDTYRAKMVLFTGGSGTCILPAATGIGNDFFFLLRNGGTGTLTINPDGVETIDGLATMEVQPSESLLLFCSGSAWYSVGYGRSVLYNFTQLVKDVSAAGTFTLSASEAANKLLTFTGNPASGVTVVVPNVVAVYYLLSSISTAQSITVKTAAGSGVSVPQSQRVIAICDSSNVYSAQSVSASTTVTLVDGSAAAPSLAFASSTDTGLFKYGVDGVGITSNGSEVAHFDSATGNVITGALTASSTLNVVGNFTVNTNKLSVTASNGNTTWASGAALSVPSGTMTIPTIGPDADSQHTLPNVAADTFALLAATQTLTNKTLTLPQINDTSSDHQYVFAVNELAADRTVTLPLLTGNDEFVFKDHAVTLTNKTLSTSTTINAEVTNTATSAFQVPSGTEAQRPTGAKGKIRFNDDTDQYEGYDGTNWSALGGAQAGGVIYENNVTVTQNYTMTLGKNGFSIGPITVNSGVSVTVGTGQRWVII